MYKNQTKALFNNLLRVFFLYQFNVTIPDDKRVSSELKRSLEGRLPQPEQPVTLEIQMETLEVNLSSLVNITFPFPEAVN